MPKPNKKELYSLVINALTEGDSFIMSNSWFWDPCIGGLVNLKTAKRGYFSLEIYNQYEVEKVEKYEIHKYKGTISVSDKQSCNS